MSREGFEPTTNTLRGYCSTIELSARITKFILSKPPGILPDKYKLSNIKYQPTNLLLLLYNINVTICEFSSGELKEVVRREQQHKRREAPQPHRAWTKGIAAQGSARNIRDQSESCKPASSPATQPSQLIKQGSVGGSCWAESIRL